MTSLKCLGSHGVSDPFLRLKDTCTRMSKCSTDRALEIRQWVINVFRCSLLGFVFFFSVLFFFFGPHVQSAIHVTEHTCTTHAHARAASHVVTLKLPRCWPRIKDISTDFFSRLQVPREKKRTVFRRSAGTNSCHGAFRSTDVLHSFSEKIYAR